MHKIQKIGMNVLLVGFLGLNLTGCGIKVQSYHATADNVNSLERLNTKINVGKFTATKSENSILCRLANEVSTPDNESFEKYIENALIEELKMAHKYSKNSRITLTGNLNKLDVSSGMTDAHWTFDMTVSSSNGKSFRVTHTKEYTASFLGGIACQQDMPRAFTPTVEELISKIINHPKFKTLL